MQHQNSGIRRTGAVQPKVTTISDLENDRDQDLREWTDADDGNAGNDSGRKKRKGFSGKIKVTVVVAVLICGLLAARTVLRPADSGNSTYTDDDSDALNAGNFGTTSSSDKSFAQAMETIREHATTIADALDSYKREGTEGERLRYYNSSGEVAKVLVYPDKSSDGI